MGVPLPESSETVGAGDALDAAWRAHGGGLLKFAYHLTRSRSAAEDTVQAALTATFVSWGRHGVPAEGHQAYLRKAVLSAYLQSQRRMSSREHVRAEPPDVGVASHDQQLTDRVALWAALEQLPARQGAVLVLRYYEDLDERQIAECLDVRNATVRSLHARALAKLRATATELQESS